MKYLIGIIFLLLPMSAGAMTLREPCTNTDGSALEDLHSCTVAAQEVFTGTTSHMPFAATSGAGCGEHTFLPEDVIGLPSPEGEFIFTATCVDTRGNTSAVSNTAEVPFPGIAPSAPILEMGP